MIKYCLSAFAIFCALTLLSACSSIQKHSNSDIHIKDETSVYIIKNPYQRYDLDQIIFDEVKKLGFHATVGPSSDNQNNYDYVINYFDSWSWDVIPYLRSIEIQLIDSKSNLIVARSRFENDLVFHAYPSDKEKTSEIIKDLFKNAEPE